jgi:ribosome-interacting GTPase 1
MPTNLPPEYYEVEKRYRAATTPREKIMLLEELISTIPKHKGTDHLRAGLRRRLSKLKTTSQSKKGSSRQASAFHIRPEGAGQAVVVGAANVGKSSLIAALTNATPEVSPAPFTTWTPTPGMMQIDNIQVQLVDTPPLNPDYIEPEMANLIRGADLILIMVDLQTDPVQQLEDTLDYLQENNVYPVHQKDHPPESRRVKVKHCLVLANKYDDQDSDENYEIFRALLEDECPMVPISVATSRNLDQFKQTVFELLEVVRIYSQAPGKEPDFNSPFVMQRGGTVEEFARKVHQDFYKNLKSARVWGSSDFDGQMVSRDYVLEDGDVVELQM